ncbi:DUF4926 domain-containing protein [Acetobacter sp. DsW_063]|uniref:DUF4926 domain-containing protein n=1 Tax=Acetobacter sp. DsW_063 TaxID=1514894 RepID=UPI000A3A63BF|nr:DUF4926 domain-containing protein [Acetobacter sp. DsW_063]OUJ14289.1 hypothetical protein HK28_14300 [Acetobacter sp. DsW_063]
MLTTKSYPELSAVKTLKPIDVDGQILPGGSRGTIVLVYGDGDAYEVEFTRPIPAIITLEPQDITGIGSF